MICGATKKARFKTHEAALIRGGEILTTESNRRCTPDYFTAYKCDFCAGYHLTGKYSVSASLYDSLKGQEE